MTHTEFGSVYQLGAHWRHGWSPDETEYSIVILYQSWQLHCSWWFLRHTKSCDTGNLQVWPHTCVTRSREKESLVEDIQLWDFYTNFEQLEKNATFWCKSLYNWKSVYKSCEKFMNAQNNKTKRIGTVSLPISQKQYLWHPTLSPWSCHNITHRHIYLWMSSYLLY